MAKQHASSTRFWADARQERAVWACDDGQRDILSLRAGVALAGMDAEDLWAACYAVSGEYLAFESVVEAVMDLDEVDLKTWNLVARAINVGLREQGIGPLFRMRPTADFA